MYRLPLHRLAIECDRIGLVRLRLPPGLSRIHGPRTPGHPAGTTPREERKNAPDVDSLTIVVTAEWSGDEIPEMADFPVIRGQRGHVQVKAEVANRDHPLQRSLPYAGRVLPYPKTLVPSPL